MKESKENKDNLSKIRKCIAKGDPWADFLSLSKVCLQIPDEKLSDFTLMGYELPCLERHVAESTEILQTKKSEVTGTTAEIPDSGIDHKV